MHHFIRKLYKRQRCNSFLLIFRRGVSSGGDGSKQKCGLLVGQSVGAVNPTPHPRRQGAAGGCSAVNGID